MRSSFKEVTMLHCVLVYLLSFINFYTRVQKIFVVGINVIKDKIIINFMLKNSLHNI